jgi:hypothetical protein
LRPKLTTMNRFWRAVILTGLLVGTTDLFAAYMSQWIKTGKFADKMLYYIAGGVSGLETSMKGGNGMALLGLFCHYFIAFSFTLFFFWIFPKLKILAFDKYVVGMIYGILASTFMSLVVLPLSALPQGSFQVATAIVGWFILGIALGIPIAYNTYKYYGIKKNQVWS